MRKINVSLPFVKLRAMKMYGGVKIQLHAFIPLALQATNLLHGLAALTFTGVGSTH